jgi:dinuclear metal center YbgI/SA1388 family protein
MTIAEFQQTFERTTPPGAAWQHDNVGLLVGRPGERITNILVALDVTMTIAKEAVRRKANLIVAHHPLIFRPLAAVTSSSPTGELVMFLIEKNIAVYAAHTNFDSVRHGVSFALARRLGLENIAVLSPMKESLTKIAVFVPATHADRVAEAMHAAGGGMFTKYQECSFRTEGIGTFKGMNDARPFLGTVGELVATPEVRIEMLAERWKVAAVVGAMTKAHPYEEIAYDIYTLENRNTEYGLGAVGDLARPTDARKFLSAVKRKLGADGLRYAGAVNRRIARVAVCGGSGSDHIADAVTSGADAFVTADLKYHAMQDAAGRLLVIDAGHYETEQLALAPLADQIREIGLAAGARGTTFVTQYTTNPIHFC